MDGKEANSGSSGNKKQGHLPRERHLSAGLPQEWSLRVSQLLLSLPCLKNTTGPLKMVHLQKYIPFSQQVLFHLQMCLLGRPGGSTVESNLVRGGGVVVAGL